MTTFEDVWRKLSKNKKYREQYALSLLKRSVPFQIKTLRKKYFGSQADLAQAAGITQGVVSRAEDQDYGNLTLNSVGRIASGFDVAFIGRFVPFSELVRFSLDLSEEEFRNIPTFEEENSALGALTVMPVAIPVQLLGVAEGSCDVDVSFHRKRPQSAIDSGDDSGQRQTEGVMSFSPEHGAAAQGKAATAGAA